MLNRLGSLMQCIRPEGTTAAKGVQECAQNKRVTFRRAWNGLVRAPLTPSSEAIFCRDRVPSFQMQLIS